MLEFAPGRCWAIDVKLSSKPVLDRGFHNAANDIDAKRRLVVYKGNKLIPVRLGVEAVPLITAVKEIRLEVSNPH